MSRVIRIEKISIRREMMAGSGRANERLSGSKVGETGSKKIENRPGL